MSVFPVEQDRRIVAAGYQNILAAGSDSHMASRFVRAWLQKCWVLCHCSSCSFFLLLLLLITLVNHAVGLGDFVWVFVFWIFIEGGSLDFV